MSSHTSKPFHCSDCGKEFSKEKTLINHFRVHATDKIYKCEVCKAIFYTKKLYKNHLKTHTEKGNYPCPKCGKVFVRNSWLKRHLSLQCDEVKQRDNKFMCKDCGKSYDSLAGVKNHLIRGKHFKTEFRCHECSWTCTSSKALFVHVLQHSNVEVIIVGYSKEKRLEYYSTTKVPSKLAKYQPRVQVVSQEKTSALGGLLKNSSELSETSNTLSTQRTSQDTMLTHSIEDNSPSQSKALPENTEGSSNGKNLLELEKIQDFNLEENNERNLERMLRKGWVKAKLSNDKKNILKKKLRESLEKHTKSSENTTCEATQSKEKHTLSAACEIPKKMPKLLRLYPEEETSLKESAYTETGKSFSMQNDGILDQGMIYKDNHVPTQTNALVSNQLVMPFFTPLVKTMFLPPLFIVPTTVPVTPRFSQPIQNDTSEKMLMHTDTYKSHLKSSKSEEYNSSDISKEVDEEEILIKSKRKQLRTEVQKVTEQAKQVIHDDAEEKYLLQSSHKNSKGRETSNSKLLEEKEKKAKANDDVLLDKKVSVILDHFKKQLNEKPEDKNKFNTMERAFTINNDQTKNDDVGPIENDSHLWDTLMKSDTNTKSVINSKNLSLFDVLRPIDQTQEYVDGREMATNTSEEIPPRTLNGRAAMRNKQHGPTGGIDVEDYIEKFMWF